MFFCCCLVAISDPSIEVISLMKALHVINSHWTTLYEVGTAEFSEENFRFEDEDDYEYVI